jgi:hypothetical protein
VVMSGHTSRSRHMFVVGVSVTVHPDGLLALASFIIRYLGWQAGIRVVWPTQRLSAHWVAPPKCAHWHF